MHSNRSIPSQFRVYTAVPGDLLAMGKNTQRSVSYGKNYSEGVPQDLVTAVATALKLQLYQYIPRPAAHTFSRAGSHTFRGGRHIHLVEQDPIHSAARGPSNGTQFW